MAESYQLTPHTGEAAPTNYFYITAVAALLNAPRPVSLHQYNLYHILAGYGAELVRKRASKSRLREPWQFNENLYACTSYRQVKSRIAALPKQPSDAVCITDFRLALLTANPDAFRRHCLGCFFPPRKRNPTPKQRGIKTIGLPNTALKSAFYLCFRIFGNQ